MQDVCPMNLGVIHTWCPGTSTKLCVVQTSVPSTLFGHLNFRVFHDVSKAHTFLKCTKNKHVICCLHLFDDVLPHEEIIRWQIRRRETKFCEHFYDHLPFNCLQVETEEQGFVGKITARSRGLWVKFLGTR